MRGISERRWLVKIFIPRYGSSLRALARTVIYHLVGSNVFPRYRDSVCQYRKSAEISLNLGGNTDCIFALSVSTLGAFFILRRKKGEKL
jgi:hypothetical protein